MAKCDVGEIACSDDEYVVQDDSTSGVAVSPANQQGMNSLHNETYTYFATVMRGLIFMYLVWIERNIELSTLLVKYMNRNKV